MTMPATASPATAADQGPLLDVLIVGAGLSGIGAAVHLQQHCPHKSYAIVEARGAIGGTWDLFRYPGIRSDSDMYTLGYRFKPWEARKAIADGPSILAYVNETADEYGVRPHIRFNQKLIAADWSDADACWTATIDTGGTHVAMRARFLYLCSGYYDYDDPLDAAFAGRADIAGPIVHPQFWPDNLDYRDKNVVVIGSGATAVTLVPEMAKGAAHVTMLQRSPTYVVDVPGEDRLALMLQKIMPSRVAYFVTRWKNILYSMMIFHLARRYPNWTKGRLVAMATKAVGPAANAADFTPRYNPWDQRICAVPDGDLFDAVRRGRVSVITDQITRFDATGVQLASGKHVPADVIVTATGLRLSIGGKADISVNGTPVRFADHYNYKGVMFSDLPNFAVCFGYTNASWTLKADLTAEYICRVLNEMDARGATVAIPTLPAGETLQPEPMLDFNSTYVTRALEYLPKQGNRAPWKLRQNYARDLITLRHQRVDDGVLRFR